MSQNPKNIIIQTALKHCNQFRRVRTESLIWLQINIDTGEKIKFEIEVKERYQKLLDLIIIDIVKVKKKISRTGHHYFSYESNNQSLFQ